MWLLLEATLEEKKVRKGGSRTSLMLIQDINTW
jgi:hypothetical protein